MVTFFIALGRGEKVRVGRKQPGMHSEHEATWPCLPLWCLTNSPALSESPMLPKACSPPSPPKLTRCWHCTSHRYGAWVEWPRPWRWARRPGNSASWAQRQVCHLGGAGDRQTHESCLFTRRGIQLYLVAFYDTPQILPRTLPHLLQKAHFHTAL